MVEDEEAVRKVVVRALRAMGYEVTGASSGAAAIASLEDASPPALLVTDVVMPDLDGVSLAEKLAARVPGLKVLFTSGYIDERITRRGLDRRGAAFLQKPFSPDTLTARVRELLDTPSSDALSDGIRGERPSADGHHDPDR